MVVYIGFLMVAFFDGCDPVALGELATIDQMTILMANRIFGYTIILLGKVHYWGPNEKSYVKI
jgi:hypothetical protein